MASFFNTKLIKLEETSSTNDFAYKLLKKGKIKGKGKEARITEEKKLLASVSQKLKIILDRKILKEDEVQDKINGKL